ncbi:hypothetical protein P152DRAFT_460017 [Eremomyces bilateralis CBS 781.70]|uniref:BZIP domain-containing protein n=1 Tax=Eremomyces bilateralis CBS 781.70 TaxID=1392243 RepID=A0A6G1FZP2_9PEZI|nr:uncharacterized protein P152DRAFT_460017 [Eremomyces bilateralis CBS 781.70]KAF1811146.1 hypothetical protein P152DRAFT_460017 [Eremomyces bilateralis CBS 781.70]
MTFQGRPAPNVSQYLQNLNTIDPQPIELPTNEDYGNFAEDLALFTNLEFVDFDQNIGGDAGGGADEVVPYDAAEEERARRLNASAGYRNQAKETGMGGKTEGFEEQFQFPDFNPALYPNVTDPGANPTYPSTVHNAPFPIQPALSPTSSTTSNHKPNNSPTTTSQHGSTSTIEDHARNAAEEDKRRRNTAASARFRIKKKQREQEVEKTAKEMSERVGIMEARVKHLEMENEWLRSLIVDKSGNVPSGKGRKEDEGESSVENDGEREGKRRKKQGVGTEA